MPPVQAAGQPQPAAQPVPGAANQKYYTAEQVEKLMAPKKDTVGTIKTVLIVVISLIAVTFVGLFIWMYLQYDEARTDVDGQITVAVEAARAEQATKDEEEFLEREKDPFRDFSGPVDYGELSFKYPKTWSVFVEKDASNGGDFVAYFNPIQIEPISNDTVNALELSILDDNFEDVTNRYQQYLKDEKKSLSVSSIMVNGTAANRYDGVIPGTEFNGIIVVIKIRDKTAVLQTDSLLFESDFEKVIESIQFNA